MSLTTKKAKLLLSLAVEVGILICSSTVGGVHNKFFNSQKWLNYFDKKSFYFFFSKCFD